MTADVVIRAEHLGKKYIIGHQAERESYAALRDVIARGVRSWARSVRDLASGRANIAGDELEEFWALKDVNFEIRRGDVVGVIGRNGAGKSTLLKVLSRITEPSEGRVEIRGRVASLLEVGTGFHPELTGRENVYLNGAILGMSRAEIKQKFDEIVAFAEIDKFLDTPVKRYSSGMYVRLAFAVAAHLDPEILIVDEVLAVGDAEFQKKCLGKMKDVAGHGRTVLFVSHNTASLAALTDRCIHLIRGEVHAIGSTSKVIQGYLAASSKCQIRYQTAAGSLSTPSLAFAEILTSTRGGEHEYGSPLELSFGVYLDRPRSNLCFSFQLRNWQQTPIVHGFLYPPALPELPHGLSVLRCTIARPRLNVGDYHLTTYLSDPPGGTQWEILEGICQFQVVRNDSNPYWGWRNDACAYFEDFDWAIEQPTTVHRASSDA